MKTIIQYSLLCTGILFFISCGNTKLIEVKDNNDVVIEKYELHKDGYKEGIYQSFYNNGNIKESATFNEGKLNGERIMYHKDGKVDIIEFYINDVMTGDYKDYDEDGNLVLVAKYVDGVMDGVLTKYYPDGTLNEEVTMKNNEENGPFKEYYENGQVHWEGNYLNGDNEFGELLEYDDQGVLLKKMNCDSLAVCRTVWTKEKGVVIPKY